MDQEQLLQLQLIEQESHQLEQQSELIQQNLIEMQNLFASLDEIEKTDKKEILAGIGRGIYIPAEIKDKTLIMEVGNKVLVKKSVAETKKIVEEQMDRLDKARIDVENRIEELRKAINEMMKREEKKGK